MNKWAFLAAIILACVLEVTSLNYFRVFNVSPQLLLVAVVVASLAFDLKWALFFSILSGILKDIFCPESAAFNTLLFAFWSFLIVRLSRKISVDNNFIRVALLFIITILNNILVKLSFVYLGKFIPLGIFLRTTFLESLYTVFVSVLVFKIIGPTLQS